MSMFAFVLLLFGLLFAAWVIYQMIVGAVLITAIMGWIAKGIFKLFGSISTPEEIVGEPLTEEFKRAARGKLAPDMWTDGRRIYFEHAGKSYSVAADLEAARKRKNDLIRQTPA